MGYDLIWYNIGMKIKGNVKLTIEFVRGEFKKEGYKLLTNHYENSSSMLHYVCPVGHKHRITWG